MIYSQSMLEAAKKKQSLFKMSWLNWPDGAAFLICLTAFFFWLTLLYRKFTYFGYYDWDLAMYAQATWALGQGSLHSSIFGTSFLTNHAEYIAFFIAPVYKLFPSAFTLVVLKTLSLVSASFVFYLIIKNISNWRLGIVFMLLYLLHPANAFMMIYEFHFENLAIIPIFLMYYFVQTRRFIPFLISAFFATIVKENISLVVFMFGLYILLKRKPKEKKWALGPVILGLGVFILTMFILTPYLRSHEGLTEANQYLSMYWDKATDSCSLTDKLSHNLAKYWQTLSGPMNQNYLKELFLPFHILPFLNPLTLFLGLPIFLQHFLSPAPTNHTLYYHYAATAIIFIFLASAESLALVQRKFKKSSYIIVLLLTLLSFFLYTKNYLPNFEKEISPWEDRLDTVRKSMAKEVPSRASIVVNFDFLAPLANRAEIFSLHNVWQNYATFTGKTPFVLPDTLSYALVDWMCPWLWDAVFKSERPLSSNKYLQNLNKFYFSRSWHTVKAVEEITLLSTTNPGTNNSPLVENSLTPFLSASHDSHLDITIGNELKLISLSVKPQNSQDHTLPLTFVWQAQAPIEDLLGAKIRFLQKDNIITEVLHPLGYAFNLTPLWKQGQYVKEHYNIYLAQPLTRGEYLLDIAIAGLQTGTKTVLINGKQTTSILIPVLIP